MWQPEPDWVPVGGGRGALTVGLWRAERDGRSWAVKRIRVPTAVEADLAQPTHPGYWRREVEVALSLRPGPGLVAPEVGRVDEDPEGCTLWATWRDREPVSSLFVARALGRFAATELPGAPWLAQRLLGERLARAEPRGGWPTLARTRIAELAGRLWSERVRLLAAYDGLPQVAAHGDVVPANVVAPAGDDLVVLDWSALGWAPAGADLGYYVLSCTEDLDVLLDSYATGLAEGGVHAERSQVGFAARVMAVYTVFAQAEWALARVAASPGALEAKYRHPSVAPYLRALQRRLPDTEVLLDAGVSARRGG